MPFTGEVDISGILSRLGTKDHNLKPARPVQGMEDEDGAYRAAYGELDMSMSTGLAVIPKIIWDVNGYYRSLGIERPYMPTRKMLRQGYQQAGGPDNERLTYYLKQLLDNQVRSEYDAMPLGSRYRDKYEIEQDMRRLSDVAKEMSEEEGRIVTVENLVDMYRPLPALEPLGVTDLWNWGFYALKSRKYNTEDLSEWQKMLTRSFTKFNVAPTISLGYIGGTPKEYVIVRHDERDVIFLNENTKPSQGLADAAASKFIAQGSKEIR